MPNARSSGVFVKLRRLHDVIFPRTDCKYTVFWDTRFDEFSRKRQRRSFFFRKVTDLISFRSYLGIGN